VIDQLSGQPTNEVPLLYHIFLFLDYEHVLACAVNRRNRNGFATMACAFEKRDTVLVFPEREKELSFLQLLHVALCERLYHNHFIGHFDGGEFIMDPIRP
jgi:hypothetical protein